MKPSNLSRRFRRFLRDLKAVSALEYAILVGVIAVGIGGALLLFEDQVSEAITDIGDVVDDMPGGLTAPDLGGGTTSGSGTSGSGTTGGG
ncbi:MAG: hypothetical protein OXI57_11660 [Rhodospirillales bacterium]|nr:hypothetical protein [Rhodospirillales bacterium]